MPNENNLGAVSIVQLQLPNQPNVVQSVIQPNQQSVIQATGGAATVQTVQLISTRAEDTETITSVLDNESRKRREILARRPSYRKILNDLSSTDTGTVTTISSDIKNDDGDIDRNDNTVTIAGTPHLKVLSGSTIQLAGSHDGTVHGIPTLTMTNAGSTGVVTSISDVKTEDDMDRNDNATVTIAGTQYLKVLPASTIHLAGSQDGTLQGIQTLTMSNSGAGTGAGTIVQYATQGQDGQFYVPVTVSAADLQAYQIRGSNASSGIAQSVVMTTSGLPHPEEVTKKRELRLLKNREAAKECRRKKKEYIKCLENRVAVLENQNKALIEELKSLKELYCQKAD